MKIGMLSGRYYKGDGIKFVPFSFSAKVEE